MELNDILRLIAETAAWWGQHGSEEDVAGSLRTPALRPANLSTAPSRWGTFEYDWATPERSGAVVAALAARRAELLRAEGGSPDDKAMDRLSGRLLIAEPWNSDWMGLSEDLSAGFVDTMDIPAWDTWLCSLEEPTLPDPEQMRKTQDQSRATSGKPRLWPFRKVRPIFVERQPPATVSYLPCWVPLPFVGLVEDGMAVNPVDCFFWASDYRRRHFNTPLMQQLDAAGWLPRRLHGRGAMGNEA